MQVRERLCYTPGAIKDAVQQTGAHQLVLGLCSDHYPELEIQAHARKAGINPLGIQAIDLGSYCIRASSPSAKAELMLAAAVARARAFPGSRPENLKAVLPSLDQKVSRRALFSLLPITYVSVPTVNRARCAAGTGCDQCVRVCPHDAVRSGDSLVQIDRARCQSCGLCVTACPWRALELPGWSAEEMEAQVNVLLASEGDVRERTLLFICKGAPAPDGEGFLPVTVPCLGMVPVAGVLWALARGFGTIAFSSCSKGCPNDPSGVVRGRVDYCQQLLRLLGESPDRVRLLDPDDGPSPAPAPTPPALAASKPTGPVSLFGRGAAARAVTAMAGCHSANSVAFDHEYSPLGLVRVDSQACTSCGNCAGGCPTRALSYERRGENVALVYDAALCTGCGRCLSLCPEKNADAIAVTRTTDVSRLSKGPEVLLQDAEVRCKHCGAPFASRRTMEHLAAVLGADYGAAIMAPLCTDCKGLPAARA